MLVIVTGRSLKAKFLVQIQIGGLWRKNMRYLEQAENVNKKLAGIYLISNTINNKHYVGQSIYLRKRLLKHYYNWKNNQYDCPLYRAFTKYGIDAFKITLLWTTESTEYNKLKSTLDSLEKKYIEEYHSYDEYNQTKGGNVGIVGYKFTEKQREKTFKNGRYTYAPIHAIDLTNGWSYNAINITILLERLGISKTCRSSVSRHKNSKSPYPYRGRYFLGSTYQECKDKWDEYLKLIELNGSSKYYYSKGHRVSLKYSLNQILQILFRYKDSGKSLRQIAKIENINIKTLYNYVHKLLDSGIECPIPFKKVRKI